MRAKAKYDLYECSNVLYLEPRQRRELAVDTVRHLRRWNYTVLPEENGVVVCVPPLGSTMTNRELMIDYRYARDLALKEVSV